MRWLNAWTHHELLWRLQLRRVDGGYHVPEMHSPRLVSARWLDAIAKDVRGQSWN